MRRLIITADDYGMCEVVDKAIDDCAAAGLLTSTNVIVNMEDLKSVETLRERHPQISVGMHWNVTAGKPVSVCPSLVNPKTGEFWKLKDFISRFKNGYLVKQELRNELTAQYETFKAMCGPADYWNVHMNSQLDFKIFPFFNSLALELGMNKTRSFRRVYITPSGIPGGLKGRIMEAVKKQVIDIWFGRIIPKTGTRMPDGRIMYFNSSDKTKNIHNVGRNVNWGGYNKTVELVIHPATVTDYPGFGTLTTERLAEWKMFTDNTTAAYFKQEHIELVNFDVI